MKRAIFIITCLSKVLGTLALCADDYPTDPSAWEVIDRPSKSNRDAYYAFLHRANYSRHEWHVSVVDGKVVARLREDVKPAEVQAPEFDTAVQLQDAKAPAFLTIKVSDGWIAAYNQGEFGSAVYWFSENGKSKKKLSDHQINEFLIEGDRIFAVEGLAHLSLSQGSMIEIKKEDRGWKIEEFLPLPESAEAIAGIGEGDYAVVTSDMLLRVNLDRQILMLIPSGEWGGLYPNSVATDGKYLYIGMRQFVARCKLGSSVQSFDLLVPSSKWLNTKNE